MLLTLPAARRKASQYENSDCRVRSVAKLYLLACEFAFVSLKGAALAFGSEEVVFRQTYFSKLLYVLPEKKRARWKGQRNIIY